MSDSYQLPPARRRRRSPRPWKVEAVVFLGALTLFLIVALWLSA